LTLTEAEKIINGYAEELYNKVLSKFLSGEHTTAKEIKSLLRQELGNFNADAIDVIETAVLYRLSVNVPLTVTKPQLSKMLYKNAQAVERATYTVLKEYTKVFDSINGLTQEFIDTGTITESKLPKYVMKGVEAELSKLKSSYLKANYRDVMNAIKSGSEKELEKAVKSSLYARSRYYAFRIAHSESYRAANVTDAYKWKEDSSMEFVQFRMSTAHEIRDICDAFARADFGYGAGIYPKEIFPVLGLHSHCKCRGIKVLHDVKKKSGKFNGIETALNKMTVSEQKKVLGTKKNYISWKANKEKAVDIWNKARDDRYKIRPVFEEL